MIAIPVLIFFVILGVLGFIFGWGVAEKRRAKAEIEKEYRERIGEYPSTPEFASDAESKEMVCMTMEHLPDLLETMKRSKQSGDLEWINRFLEDEDNIVDLRWELERYVDAIFDTEDVIKYVRWFYEEKV